MRSVRRESTLLLQLHRSQAPLHLRSFQWFLQGMKWIVEKTPTFVSYFLYFIILCNVINYSLYLSFLYVCVWVLIENSSEYSFTLFSLIRNSPLNGMPSSMRNPPEHGNAPTVPKTRR